MFEYLCVLIGASVIAIVGIVVLALLSIALIATLSYIAAFLSILCENLDNESGEDS